MAKGMNVAIEELDDIPEIIDYFKHVWEWFLALNYQRPVGFGLSAISFSELKAYLDLMHIDYLREDIEAFSVIDRVYLEVMRED